MAPERNSFITSIDYFEKLVNIACGQKKIVVGVEKMENKYVHMQNRKETLFVIIKNVSYFNLDYDGPNIEGALEVQQRWEMGKKEAQDDCLGLE